MLARNRRCHAHLKNSSACMQRSGYIPRRGEHSRPQHCPRLSYLRYSKAVRPSRSRCQTIVLNDDQCATGCTEVTRLHRATRQCQNLTSRVVQQHRQCNTEYTERLRIKIGCTIHHLVSTLVHSQWCYGIVILCIWRSAQKLNFGHAALDGNELQTFQ